MNEMVAVQIAFAAALVAGFLVGYAFAVSRRPRPAESEEDLRERLDAILRPFGEMDDVADSAIAELLAEIVVRLHARECR